MAEAVIVEAVRSPVGKRNGALSGVHPGELSAQVLNGLVQRAGIDPALVDDVIWGCVMQAGEQALDIARTAVLTAGWPETVPGVTVDRQCGSSQQSLHFAVAGVVAGHYDVVVAGGVESMSRTPMGSSLANGGHPYPEAFRARYTQTPNQGIGAEMIAEQWGLSPHPARRVLAELARKGRCRTGFRCVRGSDRRHQGPRTDGNDTVVLEDEGIRRGGTVESMASIKPAFKEDGVIHAGNSSQISDGSAALLVMSAEKAKDAGAQAARQGAHRGARRCRPGHHADRADPGHPEGARQVRPDRRRDRRLRGQRGLRAGAAGMAEGHRRRRETLNPNGGAIALGHPLGGSGARILTTLLYHMRDNNIQYGLQTMCEGGGQANATILELL